MLRKVGDMCMWSVESEEAEHMVSTWSMGAQLWIVKSFDSSSSLVCNIDEIDHNKCIDTFAKGHRHFATSRITFIRQIDQLESTKRSAIKPNPAPTDSG